MQRKDKRWISAITVGLLALGSGSWWVSEHRAEAADRSGVKTRQSGVRTAPGGLKPATGTLRSADDALTAVQAAARLLNLPEKGAGGGSAAAHGTGGLNAPMMSVNPAFRSKNGISVQFACVGRGSAEVHVTLGDSGAGGSLSCTTHGSTRTVEVSPGGRNLSVAVQPSSGAIGAFAYSVRQR